LDEPQFEKISEDERGANYRVILPGNRELVLIFSKAGSNRGGHSHSVPEVAWLLSGKLEVHKMREAGEVRFVVNPGETYYNAPGEPHYGHFLEDSWLLDWKLGAPADGFTTTNYEPFRKRVRPE